MIISAFAKGCLLFSVLLFTTVVRGQSKPDSIAIQAIIQEEVDAWNKGDAEMYSRHFAKDGTFTNIAGQFFTGYKAFLDRHDDIFKGMFNKTILQSKIVSFRFVRSDVAIVETLCRVAGFPSTGVPARLQLDAKGRLFTRLVQVMAKEAGDWKIITYHNVDLKPGIPVPEID